MVDHFSQTKDKDKNRMIK